VLHSICQRGDSSTCGWVWDLTGNKTAGRVTEAVLGTPLRIAVILLVALLARLLIHRLISRTADKIADGRDALSRPDAGRSATAMAFVAAPLLTARRVQRAKTLASVLNSVTTGVIGTVVMLLIMGELGYSLGPLLASAGIAGVALGFGAQTLVKDLLAGIFLLLEDQYGVGDSVVLGEASGLVEAVGLRVTRLRDVEGTVWYVRNGEILSVGNRSQEWARAVLDVTVSYGEDLERVKALLLEIAAEVRADEEFGSLMIEDPEVWGVEALNAEGVVVRLVAKTQPLQQWQVARELRRLITRRFDLEGIQVPLQQRAVWVRDSEWDSTDLDGTPAEAGKDPQSAAPVEAVAGAAASRGRGHGRTSRRNRRPGEVAADGPLAEPSGQGTPLEDRAAEATSLTTKAASLMTEATPPKTE